MDRGRDDVNVVIPTAGRRPEELEEAISSVLAQEGDFISRVIVVNDGGSELSISDRSRHRGIVVETMRSAPGLSARQTGVVAASGRWVAFLDDDDLWLPTRISTQFRLLENSTARWPVLSSRVTHVMEGPARQDAAIPKQLPPPGANIADYLFRRRSPSRRRASIFTSTLLAPRDLCVETPWKQISRHQDWDWLVRSTQHPDCEVIMAAEVLVRIRVGSPHSISRSPDWRASLTWATDTLADLASADVVADFLASQTLRYALSARDADGSRMILKAIRDTGCMPSASSLAVGAAGLVPTSVLKSILRRG